MSIDSLWLLKDLHTVLLTRAAVVPATAGAVCGLACAVWRRGMGWARRDPRSLMSFSSNGSLRCVCGTQHPEGLLADRRQFCRACGCEVVPQNLAALEKQLSAKEIRAITRSLRLAAIRASHLELPPSIATVDDLHRYLSMSDSKQLRRSMPQVAATVVEQPVIH
jgi:hypothetical protein